MNNSVTSIVGDTEGALWFSTHGGVSRFDERLVNFTSRDGIGHAIMSLYRDAEGVMWIGTQGGVSRFDGRAFAHFTTRDGLVDNKVYDIGSTPAGILCATRSIPTMCRAA